MSRSRFNLSRIGFFDAEPLSYFTCDHSNLMALPAPPASRPKSLALTVLVDWSNQDKTDNTLAAGPAGVNSTCHPCWLCVHFGPPPGALPTNIGGAGGAGSNMAGQFQLTLNVYRFFLFLSFFVLSHRNVISAEKTPLVKKQNEEPIPKERRALLWFNTQPFDKVQCLSSSSVF